MKLDFSKFKKVKEDSKTATMKHPEGHHIVISKQHLSKKVKQDLEQLPVHMESGGMPRSKEDIDQEAQGYQVQTNQVRPDNPNQPIINVNVGQPQQPQQVADAGGGMMDKLKAVGGIYNDLAGAGVLPPILPPMESSGAAPKIAQDANVKLGMKDEAAGAVDPNQPMQSFPDAHPAGQPVMEEAQPQGAVPLKQMDPFAMYDSGLASQGAGIAQEAQALGHQGQQEAAVYKNQISSQQQLMNDYEAKTQPLLRERANLQKDIDNFHIDPKKYINSMSVGSKIMTGIGIILGGMGQGLAGGNNPALDFVNKQIDADIDSQKEQLGQKKTLLEANLKNFGDLRTATEMTRVMMADMIANEIKRIGSSSQNQAVQARALQAYGQLLQNGSDRVRQNALYQTLMNRNSPQPGAGMQSAGGSKTAQDEQLLDYMRVANPEMAKSMEGRLIPGVGMAKIQVPDTVRNQMIARQDLNDALNELQKFAEENQGSIKVSNPAIVKKGEAMASLVQDAYRRANNQGVFKESENKFVNGIISEDPTAFFANWRTIPGYRAAQEDNMRQLDSMKKGYGLPVAYKPPSAKAYEGK